MAKRRTPKGNEPSTLRLIAGQFRGRRLPIPSVEGLRPSGDRVRETVFNWLQNDVPDARCLDAFAGTGALGFEAASRYAASVTLLEPNSEAAASLLSSQRLLEAASVTVINTRFEDFVANDPDPFDLVFLDPPFQTTDFNAVLDLVPQILGPDALVYLECPKALPDADVLVPESWETRRDKSMGEVRARLFRVAGK